METTTTTPSTPSATPTAAPATSAPSQTITPGQRPTFAQAFASDTALPPTTVPDSGAAAATVPPGSPETQSVMPPADKKGPIPFEVHETALRNARTKAGEEATAKWRESHGWAEQIPRADLEAWAKTAQRITADPIAHIAELIAELQTHPTYAPQLRSQAARLLAGARGPQRVDLNPDLVVRDEQGQVVEQSFSAKKMMAIVQQTVDDAISPLKQESAQRKTETQHREAERKATAQAKAMEVAVDSMMDEINGILDISDPTADDAKPLLAEVNRLMASHPGMTAHKAALEARKALVSPRLEAKATQSAVDKLKTQAAAQSVNPAGAVVSATHRPKSFNDPSLKW